MKRTLSLVALAASSAILPTTALSTTSVHAAAVQAMPMATGTCHSRNYQPGNCKHIPKGTTGSVTNPGPKLGDSNTVLHVPSTKHGSEVTANLVTSPTTVGHAAGSLTVSALDSKTNTIKRHYVPRMALQVDPKYAVCSYNVATGACTPLKLTNGQYTIATPGTYVLIPKRYLAKKGKTNGRHSTTTQSS